MAERNPRIPHSIESLLFVNRNGKYCGYKQELISDNIGADRREFLICTECEGISRKPRNWRGYTVCEMCVPRQSIVPEVLLVDIDPIPGQYYGDIDNRVENKVAILNSRCPLSGEGCGWKGKLREVEGHMEDCLKVRVQYQLECGFPIERGTNEQDNGGVRPSKMKRCDYCNQEVQANEENRHKGKCQRHPDTEVPCPYKELGCDAIVLRKNRDAHITENITSHNKLMRNQIQQPNQQKKKNQRLGRVKQQQQKNKNEKLERDNDQQKNRNEELERVNEQQENSNQLLERINVQQKHTIEQQKNRIEKVEEQKNRIEELERVYVQQRNRNQKLERANDQQKNLNKKWKDSMYNRTIRLKNWKESMYNRGIGINNWKEPMNNRRI